MPNRFYNGLDYRCGFQGQEKDNEIKGEGNSLNYTFRMHDPRVGRFFAIDPLAPQYPHNSPYAFAENRVIDGMELEGLEYLNYNEARIEYTNGRLSLKLENFNDNFQKAYKVSYPVQPYYFTGDSSDMLTDNNYKTQRDVRFNKGNGNIDMRQKFKNGDFDSDKTYGKTNFSVTPTMPVKGWAMSVMLIHDLYKGVKDFIITKAMVEDKNAFLEQFTSWGAVTDRWSGAVYKEKHESILSQVNRDIDIAIEMKIVPEDVSSKDRGDLANIIMFGGNGTESKQIRKTAEEIINKISPDAVAQRLLFKKIYYNISQKSK